MSESGDGAADGGGVRLSHETKAAVLTWAGALLALLVAGPIGRLPALGVRTPTGGDGATVLTAEGVVGGVVAVVVALAVAFGLGFAVKRVLSRRYAMFCAGLSLAWYASATGRGGELVREFGADGLFVRLGVETALLGAVVVGLVWVLVRRRLETVGEMLHPDPEPAVPWGSKSLAALGVAAAGTVVGSWVVATTGLPGQALAAAVVGAGLGAFGARLLVPEGHVVSVVAGCFVAGAGVLIAGGVMVGGEGLAAVYGGSLIPPARVGPGDWVAGVLIGVPLGQYAALSMLDRSQEKAERVGGGSRSVAVRGGVGGLGGGVGGVGGA